METGSRPRRIRKLCGRSAMLLAALSLFLIARGAPSRERGPGPVLVLPAGGRPIPGPRAVAAAAGRVYVLDDRGYLWILDTVGTVLRRRLLVKTARGFPSGITVDPRGGLLLADTHEARVVRLDLDGERRAAIGRGYGSGPGEFVYPQRMLLRGERIYVTEYGFDLNNRVQVFSRDGRFLFLFGGYGKHGARFARPVGIAASPDGRIYIADASHRIVVCDADGRFHGEFGGEGRAPGRLKYPYGLAADDRFLYVGEYENARVSRFTFEGVFAGTWDAGGGLRLPRDLALDGRRLYVADTGHDRVVAADLSRIRWEHAP